MNRQQVEAIGQFAWPGGYPIVFLDTENEPTCYECALKWEEEYSTELTTYYIQEEIDPDFDELCTNCNKALEGQMTRITHQQAIRILEMHYLTPYTLTAWYPATGERDETSSFYQEMGKRETYTLQEIRTWLGY